MKAVGYSALGTVLLVLRGYVLKSLWAWFIVPTFGGPAISVSVAIGISYIVGLLTIDASLTREQEAEGKHMAFGFAVVLLIWGFAAIVRLFV